MKIAVTYDNGNVFQHFGRTEAFKIYEIAENQVVSSEVVSTDGAGHEALADFLADRAIDLVLCGGMGEGARNALTTAGIITCTGVEGDADAAVAAFLAGELTSEGVNCDHHDEEEGSCGCGGGCGGCHGGCHSRPSFEGPNVGRNVRVNYRGTLNDGTQFDSSYDRGETLDFVCGAGMMIPGFDKAVATMEVGQTVTVHLMPDEAYGYPNPNAIFPVEIAQLPGSEELEVGQRVVLYTTDGRPMPVAVVDKTDAIITFDANHELAGKELNFTIELVEVQ